MAHVKGFFVPFAGPKNRPGGFRACPQAAWPYGLLPLFRALRPFLFATPISPRHGRRRVAPIETALPPYQHGPQPCPARQRVRVGLEHHFEY